MKLCPKCGQPNLDTAVICAAFACIHLFVVEEPKPAVASVRRSYPSGTTPEFDTGNNFWKS